MPRESEQEKKKRARRILKRLMAAYPHAGIKLNFKTNMQLLAAVILSAQATDEHVNEVTKDLFKKYKTVDDFADANIKTLRSELSSINYYKSKAKYIAESARMIRDEYGGNLPRDINEMVKLPGVGRKTANIVLWNAYGIAQGIPVDTHVKRVAKKLGLTSKTNPDKVEKDLMKLYHRENWGNMAYYFQAYGRTVMKARGKPERDDPLKGLY